MNHLENIKQNLFLITDQFQIINYIIFRDKAFQKVKEIFTKLFEKIFYWLKNKIFPINKKGENYYETFL
jgi:hypothetical protein